MPLTIPQSCNLTADEFGSDWPLYVISDSDTLSYVDGARGGVPKVTPLTVTCEPGSEIDAVHLAQQLRARGYKHVETKVAEAAT